MYRLNRRNYAGLALLVLVAVMSLLLGAAAQELRPKGKIAVKKVLHGGIAFSSDSLLSMAVYDNTIHVWQAENAPLNDFELYLPDFQPRSQVDVGSANPQQPCGEAASVEGTTWDNVNAYRLQVAYEFQKGGEWVYHSSGLLPFTAGRWKQNGACLSFEDDDFAYEVRIWNDSFTGTSTHKRNGRSERITAVRRAGDERVVAAPDGSFDGMEVKFDRSGKAIEIEMGGKPVKSGGEWRDLAGRVDQLHEQAKFSKALPVAERALKVAEQSYGPEDLHVAISLNSLAVIYNALDSYDAALPIAQRAVALHVRLVGPDHAGVGNALNTLGMSYSGQEKYVEAEEAFARAIAVTEKAKGPKDKQLGGIYDNLGAAYSHQDKYDEAETAYQRALEILEEEVGPQDQRLALALNGLAYVKKQKRDYDGALTLYKRSLEVLERGVGENHPYVAVVLENLAAVYELIGLTKEAQEAAQRAQRIRSKR